MAEMSVKKSSRAMYGRPDVYQSVWRFEPFFIRDMDIHGPSSKSSTLGSIVLITALAQDGTIPSLSLSASVLSC